MENQERLWYKFTLSGRVDDYLAYCSAKEGTGFGHQKGTNDIGRIGSERNECRGER